MSLNYTSGGERLFYPDARQVRKNHPDVNKDLADRRHSHRGVDNNGKLGQMLRFAGRDLAAEASGDQE
jgi:hypothetical protein